MSTKGKKPGILEASIQKKIDDVRSKLTAIKPMNIFDRWNLFVQLSALHETYKSVGREHVSYKEDSEDYKIAERAFLSEMARLNQLEKKPLPVAPSLSPVGSSPSTGEFSSQEDEDMCKYFVRSFIESDGCRENWFDNITGLEDVKRTLIDNLVNARVLSSMFSRTPKGFLLYGPPGVGKTLLIKALVNELRDKNSSHVKLKGQIGALFYNVGAAELMDKYVGESEKKIQNLFKMASLAADTVQNAQRAKEGNANYKVFSIIFMDEVDAIAPQREGSSVRNSSVNTLLTAIDGMTSSSNVVVIAATNHPDKLDAAFRERLSKRVFIPYPTEQNIFNYLTQRMDIIINKNIELSELKDAKISTSRPTNPKTSGCDIVAMYEESDCQKPQPRVYSMNQEDISKFIPNLTKNDILNLAIALSGKGQDFSDEKFQPLSGRTDHISNRQLDAIFTQASEKCANRASKIGVFATSWIGKKQYLFSLDSFPIVEWMGKDPSEFQFLKGECPPEKPMLSFQERIETIQDGKETMTKVNEKTCFHLKFLPFMDMTTLHPTDAYYGVEKLENIVDKVGLGDTHMNSFYSRDYLHHLAETALYCMGKFEVFKPGQTIKDIKDWQRSISSSIVREFKNISSRSSFQNEFGDILIKDDTVLQLGEHSLFKTSAEQYSSGKDYLEKVFEHMIRGHWNFDYFRQKLKDARIPSQNYSRIINALRWMRLNSEFTGKTHTLFLKYRVAFHVNPVSDDVGDYDNEKPTRALGTTESSEYSIEDIYVQMTKSVKSEEPKYQTLLTDIQSDVLGDMSSEDMLRDEIWEGLSEDEKRRFITNITSDEFATKYNEVVAKRTAFLESFSQFKEDKEMEIKFFIPDQYDRNGNAEKLTEIWQSSGDQRQQKTFARLKSLANRKMYIGELTTLGDVAEEKSSLSKKFFEMLKLSSKTPTVKTLIEELKPNFVKKFDFDSLKTLEKNTDKLLYKKVFQGDDTSKIVTFDQDPRLDLALNWNIDIKDLIEAARLEKQSFPPEQYEELVKLSSQK